MHSLICPCQPRFFPGHCQLTYLTRAARFDESDRRDSTRRAREGMSHSSAGPATRKWRRSDSSRGPSDGQDKKHCKHARNGLELHVYVESCPLDPPLTSTISSLFLRAGRRPATFLMYFP